MLGSAELGTMELGADDEAEGEVTVPTILAVLRAARIDVVYLIDLSPYQPD